jgi:hypothetical protein
MVFHIFESHGISSIFCPNQLPFRYFSRYSCPSCNVCESREPSETTEKHLIKNGNNTIKYRKTAPKKPLYDIMDVTQTPYLRGFFDAQDWSQAIKFILIIV